MGEAPGSVEVGQEDRELLARFVEDRDEPAFNALVSRHGRMALGVCRRILGASSEAEDAFQATFLVLIARAAELHRSRGEVRSLGGWIHRVAANAALQMVRETKARQRREAWFAQDSAARSGESPMDDALPILDEEIQRLPERYRSPLVLCYLEDQTQQEAAEALGISYATLRRRLDQAREILRNRLVRRGCTITSGLMAAFLWESAANAETLGPDLAESLARPLLHASPRLPLGLGGISSRSVRVSRQVLRIMRNQALRKAAGLLAVLLLCGSTGLVAREVVASDSPQAPARGEDPSKKGKTAKSVRGTPAPQSKSDSKPKQEAPKSETKPKSDAAPANVDPFGVPNGPTPAGSPGFHASINVNGQTREFDNPEDYQKALGELGGPVNPPHNAAAPAAPAKKAAPASKNRRNGNARAARPAPGAAPDHLGGNAMNGGNGFGFFAEFGSGVPGGYREWSGVVPNRALGLPQFPGFPPFPGLNFPFQPGMMGQPQVPNRNPGATGGTDGFDNAVGGSEPPKAGDPGQAEAKADDPGKSAKAGKAENSALPRRTGKARSTASQPPR